MFESCTGLTSITIPTSVTSIGDGAFYSCTSLPSITLPNSVTSIGSAAFAACYSLASVTIGSGVTSIGDSAFYFCTSLTSVTIPNGVANISDYAFDGCTMLTSATFLGNAPAMGMSVFQSTASGFIVHFFDGSTGFTSPTWMGYSADRMNPRPVVTTGSASGITAVAAILHGTVNPNGLVSTARFEFGSTIAYGSMADVTLAPDNGLSVQAVSASISGLQAGQAYHYRLTATNSGGTSAGEDMTLVTDKAILTIHSLHGTVTGAGLYAPNTTVEITATPDPAYVFTAWTGDATGTDNPLLIVMDSDKTIGATFAPDTSDSDGDGLNNFDEIVNHGTDPTLPDTDGDGLTDGWEIGLGPFAIIAGSLTWSQARADAHARGGELACFPTDARWNRAMETLGANAFDSYTGLWIGASDATTDGTWTWVNGEAFSFAQWAGTRPSTASGNTLDYAEVSGGGGAEIGKWYDRSSTTIRDGYILETGYATDPLVADVDGDGLNDGAEQAAGSNPFKADTDDDGLTDSQEVNLSHTNPKLADSNNNGTNDADEDSDNDGLTNFQEIVIYGTNPAVGDTDGDGIKDGQEITEGRDPFKIEVVITLGSLSCVYDGTPKAAIATTGVEGLTVNCRYNGGAAIPVNAGSYEVVASIDDPVYTGLTSGTLVIAKAAATVTLDGLAASYDGTSKSATATTEPAGLPVNFTYDGSAIAPTNAGSYAVVCTISAANFQGSASGTLVISYMLTTTALTNGTITGVAADGKYMTGTTATLAAVPDEGYAFTGWSGDATGADNPLSVLMDSDKKIGATFARQYTLTTTALSNGTITGLAAGGKYLTGTTALLTAHPNPGCVFTGWSGDATGAENPLSALMDSNKTITATFTREYVLTTSAVTHGTITGIAAGGKYLTGATATLTANPNPGCVFTGWSGDVTGTDNPLSLLMDSDKTITATFSREYGLTTSAGTHGTITGVAAGGKYLDGATANLTATPAPGYVLAAWSGDASGADNPLSLLMDSDKAITASFEPDLNDDDSDGLTNYDEAITYGTHPGRADTDGDGLADGLEAGIGRFSIIAGTFTWAQARADAHARGGELACFPTQVRWNRVMELLGSDALDPYAGLWIGASDAAAEGTWTWVNGEAFVFKQWATARPCCAEGNTLDYAEVGGGDSSGEIGKWYDRGPTSIRDGYILEIGYSTDPTKADTDGDGLPDGQEVNLLQTNPILADTDGDGLSDGQEVDHARTNPLQPDTDGDELSDGQEVDLFHSDPLLTDTDGDTFFDGAEVEFGGNPIAAAIIPEFRARSVLGSGSGTIQFRFLSQQGRTYSIYAATDLTGWTLIETGITGTGGTLSRMYSPAAAPKRWFRAKRE